MFPNTSFGNIDSYKYFVDRGISLTKNHGIINYITSDSYLEKEYFIDLRKLLITNSSLIQNIKLGDDIFENVNLPTAIITAHIKRDRLQTEVLSADVSSLSIEHKINNLPKYFERINIDNDANLGFTKSIRLIKDENCQKLNELYEQVMGVKIYQIGKGRPKQTSYEVENDIFISGKIREEGNWLKFIDSGVKRFSFDGKAKFINYGQWLAEPRELKYFDNPKVLIREVVNPRVFACYIEEQAVIKNTNAVIIQRNQNYSLKYLLSILNSTLFSFYIFENSPKSSNKLFPSITSSLIKNFPIKQLPPEAQKPFITLVDKILTDKKLGKDTRDLEAEIDRLVYGLYDLTEAEIGVIEGK